MKSNDFGFFVFLWLSTLASPVEINQPDQRFLSLLRRVWNDLAHHGVNRSPVTPP